MKTCACGGTLNRHGKDKKGGQRYICSKCRKSITVRDGRIVSNRGPRIVDWRFQDEQIRMA